MKFFKLKLLLSVPNYVLPDHQYVDTRYEIIERHYKCTKEWPTNSTAHSYHLKRHLFWNHAINLDKRDMVIANFTQPFF